MKQLLPTFLIVMSLLAAPANAQDYEKGLEAARRCDFEAALREWLPLAEQGDVEAQKNLGALYLHSFCTAHEGFEKWYRPAEAVKWLRQAAEAGDGDAQSDLGFMYFNGDHVPQDFNEAEKWLRLAAEQGDTGGQRGLGLLYLFGRGVPQDDVEAVKWYRLVAEKGDDDAQFNLGCFYQEGKGVPQDFVEAAKWYRLAAEQGQPGAQFGLGLLYADGKGVPQDLVQAYKWIILAAAQAVDLKTEILDPILAQMTPSEISISKRLAQEWLDAHPKLAREWEEEWGLLVIRE